ncbi:MAG TPA: hypothetical protein VE993_13080 [Stellaceae bacterium]|nr:hypothetical protein [Stellaceae bacterium]
MANPREQALIDAVLSWWADTGGYPESPSAARLMQALWRYSGDNPTACPGCDGRCGEPCAPTTVEEACAALDRWIAYFEKRHATVPLNGGAPGHQAGCFNGR